LTRLPRIDRYHWSAWHREPGRALTIVTTKDLQRRAFEEAGLRVFERGWLSSNNVLFVSADTCVLIDTGYASHAEQTCALVQAALPPRRRLDRIINTHLHSDHCGGNAALQEAFGCAIDVAAGEAAKVDAWDESALTYRATGQRCERFVRSGTIADGDEVRLGRLSWRVHAAPGHDPASIVLHQPDLGLLISADALWQDGFGIVFPELVGEPGFDDVRAALDRIATLDVRWVIPGHGHPFAGAQDALDRAYRRLERLAADPIRHARHAAKVLIMFHLLEVRSASHREFAAWWRATPYFGTIHRRFFAESDPAGWMAELVRELAAKGTLVTDSSGIRKPTL
jgi:glyoxylase-like metal-dependent hydrolase (beta-lactamase superfamily II)